MATSPFSLSIIAVGSLLLASLPAVAQGIPGGAIKATTTLHPDGTQTTMVVDPEKRTAEETTRTTKGQVIQKKIHALDDQNQPIGTITYDAKGNVLYRSSYKRDGAGRIDEVTVTNNDGQLQRRLVYTFGANNKVARVDEYDAAGRLIVQPRRQGPGRPDKKR